MRFSRSIFGLGRLRGFSDITDIDKLKVNIFRADDLSMIFELSSRTRDLSVHCLALRSIAKLIKRNEKLRKSINTKAYKDLVENVKVNVNTLGPDEVVDLSFFLRVTDS